MSKQTYRVKGRVKHDGEDYEPGDDIELTKKQADQLLEVGDIAVIERAAPKAPPAPPAPAASGTGGAPSTPPAAPAKVPAAKAPASK